MLEIESKYLQLQACMCMFEMYIVQVEASGFLFEEWGLKGRNERV